VSNSNIIALVATLLVRLCAGYLCDFFGPRRTFGESVEPLISTDHETLTFIPALCLVAGAIPTFCAGGVNSAAGLYANRFFIGILGGSFVPCQVWMTGFFDKNVVGSANALAAGFGNAGGGVTYFIMPAIYTALTKDGKSPHVAWRIDFIVPGVVIIAVALCLFFLCPDTPVGTWAERQAAIEDNMRKHEMVGIATIPSNEGAIVDIPGRMSTEKDVSTMPTSSEDLSQSSDTKKDVLPPADEVHYEDNEAHIGPEQMYEAAKGEVVRKPTGKEIGKVLMSPQTWVMGAHYFCSFGAELSINSILGTWYGINFKTYHLTTAQAGDWAAMFGLLNIICRPLGGFAADYAYRSTGSVWSKKILLHTYAVCFGAFAIAVGVLNPKNPKTMLGLFGGLAFFLEGGNGLNYSLVPHVHPFANGIVSGFTGAMGNFGGKQSLHCCLRAFANIISQV